MATILTRAIMKIFGTTGTTSEFGKIGSKAAGFPDTTKDLSVIQSLPEYLEGLSAIVSDQGTSQLPYLQDMNSLFFLTTSQLSYLFQNGVPEWDSLTDYFEKISFVQDEGVIWASLEGTAVSPNLNNQPSLNQDKWAAVSAPFKHIQIENSGSIPIGFSNIHVEFASFSGDINISTLDIPKFLGQKITFQMIGSSGRTIIAGGNGIYSNGIEMSDAKFLQIESVFDEFSGLKWKAIDVVTCDRSIVDSSTTFYIKKWSSGRLSVKISGTAPNSGLTSYGIVTNLPGGYDFSIIEDSSFSQYNDDDTGIPSVNTVSRDAVKIEVPDSVQVRWEYPIATSSSGNTNFKVSISGKY